MKKPTLLIVDDDEDIRSQLKWALSDEYELLLAGDRPGALARFTEHQPPVVVLDLGLPPRPADPDEGLATLADLLAANPRAKVVIATGQGEKHNALNAIGDGAYDFLCKPVELEELKVILRRAFHVARLEQEHRQLQETLAHDDFEGMLGHCAAMQRVFNAIRRVATTDAAVLLLGESGTGKEMAALALHRQSRRRHNPFVAINCGAIPETLLESELFGHEKGAFTGAHVQRKGRIEAAAEGTLFLDEIGEIPPSLQVKLLRFLQEQSLERVGGRVAINVDTRVIAATNVDLKKAMAAGQFREDLYYRLAVVPIELPPLRERPEDIETLARFFLRKYAAETSRPALTFSPAARRALRQHLWPGNVRELENRLKRAVIMAEGRQVSAADLDLDAEETPPATATLKAAREAAEHKALLAALQRHHWKITPAAAELDISRPTLYELMDKLHIQKPSPAEG
jgi:two-component system, NtrC family, response regulator